MDFKCGADDWFLSRTPPDCTVVLDEPDVYMHPDLQRRLFRLTRTRFRQCIIATHSVEIMAESDPGNILIIDKKEERSRYANNEPGVQLLIDQIGGIHNVHLASFGAPANSCWLRARI